MNAKNSKNLEKTLVLCDFDGTITQEDVGYNFLNRFARKSWEEIDRGYVAGRIGSREAYTRIAELMAGTKEEMVNFVCQDSSLDPFFREFYSFCGEHGIALKIVSDGFGLYIDALLDCNSIHGIERFANEILFKGKGGIGVDFPFHNPECGSCGNCKRMILKRFKDEYDYIIFIGNGLSDRCAAEEADDVYAKSSLYSHCIEKDISCWHYDDFSYIKKNFSKKIRGVIFDLDGTLINSVESIHESFNYALQSLGHQQIGVEGLRALSVSSIADTMGKLIHSHSVSDAMNLFKEKYIELIVDSPPLFSDVMRVTSSLKDSGLVLGIATNMESIHAQKILKKSHLEEYFTVVIGADDSERAKPHPDMLFQALNHMNLPNEDVVFVGDSVIDIETGKNADVDVYAVQTGFEAKGGLAKKRPNRIMNRLNDLTQIIGNSSQGSVVMDKENTILKRF